MKKIVIGVVAGIISIIIVWLVSIIVCISLYGVGDTSVSDVIMVNFGIKDYIIVDSDSDDNYVIANDDWDFKNTILKDMVQVNQMGDYYECIDKDGNQYGISKTDDWCIYFRVFAVDKNIKIE